MTYPRPDLNAPDGTVVPTQPSWPVYTVWVSGVVTVRMFATANSQGRPDLILAAVKGAAQAIYEAAGRTQVVESRLESATILDLGPTPEQH